MKEMMYRAVAKFEKEYFICARNADEAKQKINSKVRGELFVETDVVMEEIRPKDIPKCNLVIVDRGRMFCIKHDKTVTELVLDTEKALTKAEQRRVLSEAILEGL